MESQDKEPSEQHSAKNVTTPAPSVAFGGGPADATPAVLHTTEAAPCHEVQPPSSSDGISAPRAVPGASNDFHPPTLKQEVSLTESLDAPSIGTSSATPVPAEHQQDRPDDTDFVQYPVQHAQLADEQELEPEVRRVSRQHRLHKRRRRRSASDGATKYVSLGRRRFCYRQRYVRTLALMQPEWNLVY